MDHPTWHGIELDAETALALLEWQAEMGVDEAIGDAPVDRYAEPVRPATGAPEPAPAAAPPANSTSTTPNPSAATS